MDKQNIVYPYNGVLFNNKKRWSTKTCYNMINLKSIQLTASPHTTVWFHLQGYLGVTGDLVPDRCN